MLTMFRTKSKHASSGLKAASLILLIQCCFSLPVVTEIKYSSFVAELTASNCTLPGQVPVSFGANETTLEASLWICNSPDYIRFNAEVPVMCNEIYGLLKKISCPPQNAALPKIQVELSTEVCDDFASHEAVLPAGLLKHLSDGFNCKFMCTRALETPCKVLLWSFLVQEQMKGAAAHEILNTQGLTVAKTEKVPKSNTTPLGNELPDENSEVGKDNRVVPENTNSGNNQELNGDTNDAVEAKEPKKPLTSVQDLPTKPITFVPHVQDNSMKKTPVNGTEKPGAIIDNTPKVKGLIPISTIFTIPSAPTTQDETNSNVLPANDAPNPNSKETQEEAVGSPDAGQKPQPESSAAPKLPAATVTDAAANKDPADDSQKPDALDKPEKPSPDKVEEPGNAIQDLSVDGGVPPQTDEKADVAGKKVVDMSVSVPGQSSTGSATEQSLASVSASIDVSVVTAESVPKPSPVVPISVTPSLERMEDEPPVPNERDDQYNDLDNENGDLDGEYSKQEYGDGGIYEPTKSKEPVPETPKSLEIPKAPVVPQIDDPKEFDGLSSRDSFGRGSNEIPVISGFPDEEDGHFFFYFLSIVLIVMIGYLVFHNKQKIIALIVEGRHERRRRSHGLGYKKLETK